MWRDDGDRRRARARERPRRHTARVRLTDFWDRMREQFGSTYAESWAHDFVLADLGGRTVYEALGQGEDAGVVWRAVCRTVEVPARLR